MQKHTLQDRLIISILTAIVFFLILAVFGESQAAAKRRSYEGKSGVINLITTGDSEKNIRKDIMENKLQNQDRGLEAKDTVILLHGLGRTSRSMRGLKKNLENGGFTVVNINYPSRKLSIEQIAEEYLAPAVQVAQANSQKIHFVSHSMGGIVVRHYLAHTSLDKVGRVIMLAPPNGGSELIDILKKSKFVRCVIGPAACQLSTDNNTLVKRLGRIEVPTGVITGSWSWNPLFSLFITGADDGKVSVESSKLPGMIEHMVVPTSHTFIMQNIDVHQKTVHFLKTASFQSARFE